MSMNRSATNQNTVQIDMLLGVLGLDRQKLADELQLDRTTVSRALSGSRNNQATKEKIADAISQHTRKLVLGEATA